MDKKLIEVTIEGVIYLVEHWFNISICEYLDNVQKAVDENNIKPIEQVLSDTVAEVPPALVSDVTE